MIKVVEKLRTKWRLMHLAPKIIYFCYLWRFDYSKIKLFKLRERNPNLVLLGSQKCGTTSLAFYLDKHPDICLTSPYKEDEVSVY